MNFVPMKTVVTLLASEASSRRCFWSFLWLYADRSLDLVDGCETRSKSAAIGGLLTA